MQAENWAFLKVLIAFPLEIWAVQVKLKICQP